MGFSLAVLMASSATSVAAANPNRASAGLSGNVIVVLRDQHTDLTTRKGRSSPRLSALRTDQAGLIATAKAHGAKNLRGFDTVNGVAATVTADQAAQLAADPAVAAVYPDLQIKAGPRMTSEHSSRCTHAPVGPEPSRICPTDPAKPLLEPEALAVTNTAFRDPSTPQAQTIVDGTGIKVGCIADGIDINNPDFIRADGSHVFVDYQDFSGEGPDAPSSGRRGLRRRQSSIAAQGRHIYDLARPS